eukprot:TRINITY_DN6906_c0_g1_i2.p1 TRINITY_DN6906_c0_g1~~TRINITY_DN6906_c0_g1_i2.p1  ORF type:complete len:907 (-),score=175.93 TRINITY_DN6906_c0_g1_i2:1480-4167(-)
MVPVPVPLLLLLCGLAAAQRWEWSGLDVRVEGGTDLVLNGTARADTAAAVAGHGHVALQWRTRRGGATLWCAVRAVVFDPEDVSATRWEREWAEVPREWAPLGEVPVACAARVALLLQVYDRVGSTYEPVDVVFAEKCVPRVDCGSHGLRHVETGECVCQPGWSGQGCNVYFQAHSEAVCVGESLRVDYAVPDVNSVVLTAWVGMRPAIQSAPSLFSISSHDYPEWRFAEDPDRLTPAEAHARSGTVALDMFVVPGHYRLDFFWNSTVYRGQQTITVRECTAAGASPVCPAFATVVAPNGEISLAGAAGFYPPNLNCSWLIAPRGDAAGGLSLTVSRMSVDASDRLSIYNVDVEGGRVLLGTYHRLCPPPHAPIHARGPAALIVFTSDGSRSGRGFTLKYLGYAAAADTVAHAAALEVATNESCGGSGGWRTRACIAAVVVVPVSCAAVAASVLAGCAAAAVHAQRRCRRCVSDDDCSEEEGAEVWSDYDAEAAELSEPAVQQTDSRPCAATVEPLRLSFGSAPGVCCPVGVTLEETVTLSNASRSRLRYTFYLPQDAAVFACTVIPGRGTLPPRGSAVVTIHFMLHYTTAVRRHVKVVFTDSHNVEHARVFLLIDLEGAVSDSIDPEDIVLETGDPLGSGGFGSVYKGLYKSQLVAVKIPKRQHHLLAHEYDTFNKEIDLLKRLRNRYIVEFIGASVVPQKLCICTEYIEHGSLAAFIHCGAIIPFELQVKFASDTAQALSFLHDNNVIYRDMKSSNILVLTTVVTAKVNCKLTDFGTAKNVKNIQQKFPHTGCIGTPSYMAPEMLSNSPYNHKVDVFSFAVVLWEMLARAIPWAEEKPWDIPKKVISGARLPIPEDTYTGYRSLINCCWDEIPDVRHSTAFICNVGDKTLATT